MKEKIYVLLLGSFMELLLEKLKVLNTRDSVLFFLLCYGVPVCRTFSSTDIDYLLLRMIDRSGDV